MDNHSISILTSVVCKASEQLLKKKIIKDLEVKGKWPKIQFGLNENRLC